MVHQICSSRSGADRGRGACSAVGRQQLHYGMAIEIEGVFEITDD